MSNKRNSCRYDSFLTLFTLCIYNNNLSLFNNPELQNKDLDFDELLITCIKLNKNQHSAVFDYWILRTSNNFDRGISSESLLYEYGAVSSLFTSLNNCYLFKFHYESESTCNKCKEIKKVSQSLPVLIPITMDNILDLNTILCSKFEITLSKCINCCWDKNKEKIIWDKDKRLAV